MRLRNLLLGSILLMVGTACSARAPGGQPQRDAQFIAAQLEELAVLPCPAGCDAQDWAQLKSALREVVLHPPRQSAIAPAGQKWRAIMQPAVSPNIIDGWHYVSQGDYNQDGVVSISDLTPLGAHFLDASGGGPFPFFSIQAVIDGDSNGELNISDLTPLGVNLGAVVSSYNIYGSDDSADVPADGAESTIDPLGNVLFSTATGDRSAERLFFPWPTGVSPDFDFVWVRPQDDGDSSEGIRSTVVGQGFTLDLADPPAVGDGTVANPYLLGNDADFELSALLEFGGDVTINPGTAYTMTPPDAAEVNGLLLHVGSGDLTFTLRADFADFDTDTSLETSNTLHLRKGQPDEPPVAALTVTPDSGPRPLAATLDASASTDDGSIAKYEWDRDGDGVFELDSGGDPTIDFAFTASGPQNPSVRVTDDGGLTGETSAPVNVEGSWHIVTVDSTENFNSPSLAIVNGLPAIAYTDDAVDKLVFVRASDADGTAWGTPVMPDPLNPSGFLPSLVIAAGNPAVVYQGQPPANVDGYIRALDPDGTLWGPATTFGFASNGISGAVVNGFPALAYTDKADAQLRYLRADDAAGATWLGTPVAVDPNATVEGPPSLAVVGPTPAITYKDTVTAAFLYCAAADADGAAWEAPLVAIADAGNSTFTSLVDSDGTPVFASNYGFSAQFTAGLEPLDLGWRAPVLAGPGFMPLRPALALSAPDVLPMMAFDTPNSDEVRFAMAGDQVGSIWAGEVVDSSADSAPACASVNGHPAIAYIGSTSGELKYAVFF